VSQYQWILPILSTHLMLCIQLIFVWPGTPTIYLIETTLLGMCGRNLITNLRMAYKGMYFSYACYFLLTRPSIYGIRDDITLYFAHHKKLCLVDGDLAFMGGLDLCFERVLRPLTSLSFRSYVLNRD
jgi:hypothetical protein